MATDDKLALIRIEHKKCPEEPKKCEKKKKCPKKWKCKDRECNLDYIGGIKYLIYLFIISLFISIISALLFIISIILLYIIDMENVFNSEVNVQIDKDTLLDLIKVDYSYGGKLTIALRVINYISRYLFWIAFTIFAVLFVVFMVIYIIYCIVRIILGEDAACSIDLFCACKAMGVFTIYDVFFGLFMFLIFPGPLVFAIAAFMKIFFSQVLGKSMEDANNKDKINSELNDIITNIIDDEWKLCPERLKELKKYLSTYDVPVSFKFENKSADNKDPVIEKFVNSPSGNTSNCTENCSYVDYLPSSIKDVVIDGDTTCILNTISNIRNSIPIEVNMITTECTNLNVYDVNKGFKDYNKMWNHLMSFVGNSGGGSSDGGNKNTSNNTNTSNISKNTNTSNIK